MWDLEINLETSFMKGEKYESIYITISRNRKNKANT